MRWEAGPCNKASTPEGIFCDIITKAKEAPSHEVRGSLLDTNPVFQFSNTKIHKPTI